MGRSQENPLEGGADFPLGFYWGFYLAGRERLGAGEGRPWVSEEGLGERSRDMVALGSLC